MSLLFPIKALRFFQSKHSRNGTNGRPLPAYLFLFFVQTFPSSSSLRAITVAPVIFPQRKQNYLKRDPNGYCSQAACRGTCSLPVVIPSVCVCAWKPPCLCMRKNQVGQARHTWRVDAGTDQDARSAAWLQTMHDKNLLSVYIQPNTSVSMAGWSDTDMDTAGSRQTDAEITSSGCS